VPRDVLFLERQSPVHANESIDIGGYEADEDESDNCDSDSSSINGDQKHITISKSALTSRRRRRRKRIMPSLVGLLSTINPQYEERKSAQFVAIIRSYCNKQADYLQLQRNFLAARCCDDDLSCNSTSSTIHSHTLEESVVVENYSNLSDGNDEKGNTNASIGTA
jgi:hypothetical protein